MNKYELNYLRFLTGGNIEDEILEKSYNFKIEDGKYMFNVELPFTNSQDWLACYGKSQ